MIEIYRKLSFDKYKEWDRLNASYVKKYLTSGIKSANHVSQKKQTLATQLGKSVHNLVLENKRDFIVRPEKYAPRSKQAMDYKQNQKRKGVEVVTLEYSNRVENICDAIMYSDVAHEWLSATSDRETSFNGEIANIPVKARFDGMYFETGQPEFILDLKTTSNFDGFDTDFYKLGYDIQAQFYRSLFPDPERIIFTFIVAETVEPYRVKVVTCNSMAYDTDTFNQHIVNADTARRLDSSYVYSHANSKVYHIKDIPSWILEQRDIVDEDNELVVSKATSRNLRE